MPQPVQLHDVVALLTDLPQRGLQRGQVGTVVEQVAPGAYEVEFSDDEGRTYASLALRPDQFLVLHYHTAAASS
jgi:hypothetical protein